jgi:hypothetical protein
MSLNFWIIEVLSRKYIDGGREAGFRCALICISEFMLDKGMQYAINW